jgi:hypothetical protein
MPGARLDVDRPLTGSQERSTRITPGVEVDVEPLQASELTAPEAAEEGGRQNAFSLGGSAASSSCAFSRGSIRS